MKEAEFEYVCLDKVLAFGLTRKSSKSNFFRCLQKVPKKLILGSKNDPVFGKVEKEAEFESRFR